MFFNTIPSITGRAIKVIEPSCQYLYKNVPKLTLAINVAILALKHFQEKQTSTLTPSDVLSISLIPFIAIIHLCHLHGKVLSQIPRGIGNGNCVAQFGTLSAEIRQALALKEHESVKTLLLITFAEIVLTIFLIFLTWISKNNFKRTLTIEVVQFLVEIFFMLAETKAYDYGVSALRRFKAESRALCRGESNNFQADDDLDSDDESSFNSTHDNNDEVYKENASNHSDEENASNNMGILCLSDLVRSFSYSNSDSDDSQDKRNSPDSQSVPDGGILPTFYDVTRCTNKKNTVTQPDSPKQVSDLPRGLSPLKIG